MVMVIGQHSTMLDADVFCHCVRSVASRRPSLSVLIKSMMNKAVQAQKCRWISQFVQEYPKYTVNTLQN